MPQNVTNGGRRRTQLSREAILEAATAIAASGAPITFRALGTALEADPTAVYRHFKDKDELVRGVYDAMLASSAAEVDRSAPWRDQMLQLTKLAWKTSEQHPHIGRDAHMLTTGGPGEMACVDLMIGLMLDAGLSPVEAVRHYSAIASYIMAIASTISAQHLASAREADPSTPWLHDLGPMDPTRYPAIAATRNEIAGLVNQDVYLMGVEVLLDPAEAAAGRGAGK